MVKIEARTLKGFRDYAPKEQLARQEIFRRIQAVFERFGFLPLSTPVLEYKDVLMNKYGDDEKLVYTFTDMGGREVAMRYDLTVPLARFVAQNQGELLYPFKRYQIAPAWRADNTQRGRLREFYQCDVDTVGATSALSDADAIACVYEAYKTIGVTNIVLRINDRRMFKCIQPLVDNDDEQLKGVIRSIDKVDKIGVEGVISDLIAKGCSDDVQSKVKEYLAIGRGEAALQMAASRLGDDVVDAVASLATIFDSLSVLGVPKDVVLFDPTIARGSDYYTGCIFEWYLKDDWGFGSIGSGGRYDNLVDQFSSQSVPAVGASIGVDRLFEWLEDQGSLPTGLGVEVVVLNKGVETERDCIRVASMLRNAGINTELYYQEYKLEKQLKYAEGKGARLAVIIGAAEKAAGNVEVRNLSARESVIVSESELLTAVQNK